MKISDKEIGKTSVEWLRLQVIKKIRSLNNYIDSEGISVSSEEIYDCTLDSIKLQNLFIDQAKVNILSSAIALYKSLGKLGEPSISGEFVLAAKPINGRRILDGYPEGRRIYFNQISKDTREETSLKEMLISLHKVLAVLEGLLLRGISYVPLKERRSIARVSNNIVRPAKDDTEGKNLSKNNNY